MNIYLSVSCTFISNSTYTPIICTSQFVVNDIGILHVIGLV